jgi:hypothetical protein
LLISEDPLLLIPGALLLPISEAALLLIPEAALLLTSRGRFLEALRGTPRPRPSISLSSESYAHIDPFKRVHFGADGLWPEARPDNNGNRTSKSVKTRTACLGEASLHQVFVRIDSNAPPKKQLLFWHARAPSSEQQQTTKVLPAFRISIVKESNIRTVKYS